MSDDEIEAWKERNARDEELLATLVEIRDEFNLIIEHINQGKHADAAAVAMRAKGEVLDLEDVLSCKIASHDKLLGDG